MFFLKKNGVFGGNVYSKKFQKHFDKFFVARKDLEILKKIISFSEMAIFSVSQEQTFVGRLPPNGTIQNSEITLCNVKAATENHPNLCIVLFSCERKIHDVAISVAQSKAVKYGLV